MSTHSTPVSRGYPARSSGLVVNQVSGRCVQTFLLLSSLELSDSKVYEPSIRALLQCTHATASSPTPLMRRFRAKRERRFRFQLLFLESQDYNLACNVPYVPCLLDSGGLEMSAAACPCDTCQPGSLFYKSTPIPQSGRFGHSPPASVHHSE